MKLNDSYFYYDAEILLALKKIMKYNALIILILAIVSCKEHKTDSVGSVKLPYFNTADFTPEWEIKTHKIPNFAFVNQNGELVTNATYKGKIYVADFFFTSCPGICPKLAKSMASLQDAYKNDDDIMLLSHTVMPWKDSVPVLNEYAKTNLVNDQKWHLVTGDKDALYDIARTGYFADEDFNETKDDSQFIHTENFILVDKEGYIRGVYNGTIPFDLKRLQRHIAMLKEEG